MQKIKHIFQKYKFSLLGAILGAFAGYAYWFYIGCSSGTCAITASPTMSVIWGTVMGALIVDIFKKEKVDEKK